MSTTDALCLERVQDEVDYCGQDDTLVPATTISDPCSPLRPKRGAAWSCHPAHRSPCRTWTALVCRPSGCACTRPGCASVKKSFCTRLWASPQARSSSTDRQLCHNSGSSIPGGILASLVLTGRRKDANIDRVLQDAGRHDDGEPFGCFEVGIPASFGPSEQDVWQIADLGPTGCGGVDERTPTPAAKTTRGFARFFGSTVTWLIARDDWRIGLKHAYLQLPLCP